MNEGWISLHRKIQSNPLWLSEPFTRGQAWVDLLLLANHKDNFIRVRGMRIDVKRGQVGISQVSLSQRWKWSKGKVIRFLNELEIEHQIEQQKNNVSSLITILNYNEYQNIGQQMGQQTEQQTVSRQNTNNNDNKENNKSLSWIDKADQVYLDFCEKYYEMLLKHGRVKRNTNWKTKAWYDAARLIVERDGEDINKMYRVLNYVSQNIGDQYFPQVWSLPSLREKWMKIIAYFNRNKPTHSDGRNNA